MQPKSSPAYGKKDGGWVCAWVTGDEESLPRYVTEEATAPWW